MKEIIYATTNKAKISMLQNILGDEYKILNLKDIGIESQVEEDGLNPKENSLKKARVCFEAIGKPCFAMDYGLYINGLKDEEQPKQDVRRIIKKVIGHNPNDEEVLEFYIDLVKKLGGKTNSFWLRSLAFVSEKGEFADEVKIPKILVDIPSKIKLEGFPLTSIQINEKLNKYESEMTEDEKEEANIFTNDKIRSFIKKCLDYKIML
ncbi:MAG: non-canonical purine NTP pyrophosphatase [Candidatus Paceibacterota bacterium]|jgi:hypothetical protein